MATVLSAAALGFIVPAPAIASNADETDANEWVPYVVSGTASGQGGVISCGAGIGVEQAGTLSLSPTESGTFRFAFCLADPPEGDPNYPIESGTFEITTARGTISGSLGGSSQAATSTPEGYPTRVELTITSSTGGFQMANGTVVMDGFLSLGAALFNATVSGTLQLWVDTPSSRRDCLHGGYANFTDENGTWFTSQQQCMRWVRANL